MAWIDEVNEHTTASEAIRIWQNRSNELLHGEQEIQVKQEDCELNSQRQDGERLCSNF